MQSYCVIVRFDEDTDSLFSKWKDKSYSLQESHYADKSWPPHMTIAVYEDIDETVLCNWTREYVKDKHQLPIQIMSLGVFTHGDALETDVIYGNPCSSLSLVDFYYGFHQKLDEYCGTLGFEYSPKYGNPVFHSTISICNKKDFNNVFDYLRDNFIPTSGKIVALEVYEIPFKLINRFELIKD
jgi:hypothetical protein